MFNLYGCLFGKKDEKKPDKKPDKEYIVIDKNFENNECIICLEDMLVDDKVKILDCGHMYHYKCIDDWIKKKKELNCPICSK
jgi:hypothetical protein